MTRINLYPWRAAKEEYKKKQFLVILACCTMLTFVFSYSLNWYYTVQISTQEDNNQYLNNEIILTNKKLREIEKISHQKQEILDRVTVLEKLDQKRQPAIYLLNQIVKLVNPLVVIKKINFQDDIVKISGLSESNGGIAKFLRDIELSANFHSAELNKIQVLNNNNKDLNGNFQHYFELQFYQKFDHSQTAVDDLDTVDPEIKKNNNEQG